jgi:hypothetical protein
MLSPYQTDGMRKSVQSMDKQAINVDKIVYNNIERGKGGLKPGGRIETNLLRFSREKPSMILQNNNIRKRLSQRRENIHEQWL